MGKHLEHHVRTKLQMAILSAPSSGIEWVPNTDVYEGSSSLIIRMEIAGVDREDIQITISDRHLVVSGRRANPRRTVGCRFRQMEIDYGRFERRITLPRTVDGNNAKANYHNGFLRIELPKTTHVEHATVHVVLGQG